MRFSRPSVALVAAFTLAGSAGAAPHTKRALKTTPIASQELSDRLARAELLAGITEVIGPGLVVILRPCPHVPKGSDPNDFLVLDQDLNGVLNALRAAGAEALAVSGLRQTGAERILVTSAVKSEGEGILINGTKLLPPYRILALGGGDAMRTELFRPGGVVKKAHLDELQMIELENVSELVIPACLKTAEPKFARVPAPTMPPMVVRSVASVPAGAPPVEMPPLTAPADPLLANGTPTAPVATPGKVAAVIPRVKVTLPKEPVKLPPPKPETVALKPEAPLPKAPPAAPPTRPMPAAELGLFGGKGLAKYHAAGCRFGERIDKRERVLFGSADAAREAGRVPCSICLPDAPERSTSR
jgi:hypothetical protein